ncbi:MAG TPA: 1-deoxy-D-xylulose-5-phosphate reductoisomerase [Candidatus Fimenecus excrementavium]|nr:1-deoxy-D-xylulose-5-phosphate reductoisomerase [Candidatus Fimenecus excrementavium]
MTKSLSILGSTGSIGTQSLDVARLRGYTVEALTAYSDVAHMEAQIREFHPKTVAMVEEKAAADLKVRVADTNTKVLSGKDGVCACARADGADTVLNSVVGMAGLEPTLAAIDAKKKLALANKETLVAGGQLVMEAAKKNGVSILPVDSEHSAIFQALQGRPANAALKKIILTASGGPFFGKTKKELEKVTVADALKHPNWEMGAKITVDSATMMNKGLELIEAVWLFSVRPQDVQIVVHRESIVHSAVEYTDNSVIAQLGLPDMRIPIQYALTYPERFESPVGELSLSEIGKLTFFEPDYDTFQCINLCRTAINKGGLFPAAVNSANEQANAMFRRGEIGFLDIAARVAKVLETAPQKERYTLEDVLETDRWARETVASL